MLAWLLVMFGDCLWFGGLVMMLFWGLDFMCFA